MTNKELFSIEYNGKEFTIFINENGIRTFLEINEKGEYEFPMLEDYLALYEIYNIHNPYVHYGPLRLNFENHVKVVKNGAISLLAVVILLNNIPQAMAQSVRAEVTDSQVVLTHTAINDKKEVITISDTKDLDKYLGPVNLTKALILDAINNNDNLPQDFKELVIEEFESLYEAHPNADYRIFYENVKNLRAKAYSSEEYYKNFPSGSEANYNSMFNIISYIDGVSKATIIHETGHTHHSFYRALDKCIIVRSENHFALNEAMTDKMTDHTIEPNNIGAYKVSYSVLNYLLEVTGYTYEEYSRYGLDKLLSKAEKMYPGVDFSYISRTLNSLVRSQIYRDVKISKGPSAMYDELFKVCLKRASIKSGYEPLNEFLTAFITLDDDVINTYFDNYNQRLKEVGFDSNVIKETKEKLKTYNQANCIIYDPSDEDLIAFGNRSEKDELNRVNEDGSMTLVNTNNNYTYRRYYVDRFENFKMRAIISSRDIKDGIISTLNTYKKFSPYNYQAISIYHGEKLVTKALTATLSVKIGFSNKEMGFILYDKDGKVIYKSHDNLTSLSNKVALNDYLLGYEKRWNSGPKLDLRDIFNEEYAKNYQKMCTVFNNFIIEDDKVVKKSAPIVTVISGAGDFEYKDNFRIAECKVYISDNYVVGDARFEPFEYDMAVDLETLLDFYNITVSDGHYIVRKGELISMVEKYVASLRNNDVYNSESSNRSR